MTPRPNAGMISMESLLKLWLALAAPDKKSNAKFIEESKANHLYAVALHSAAPAFLRTKDGISINPSTRPQFIRAHQQGDKAAGLLLALDRGEIQLDNSSLKAYRPKDADRPFSTEEALTLLKELQAGKRDETSELNQLAANGSHHKLFVRLESPRRYGLNPVFEYRLNDLFTKTRDPNAWEILALSQPDPSFEQVTRALHRKQQDKELRGREKYFFTPDGEVREAILERARREKTPEAEELLAAVAAVPEPETAAPEKEIAS